MKLLVFGKSGQVATELAGLSGVTCIGRDECDLMHPETAKPIVDAHAPDAIINAAAYTAVDKAEEEPDQARFLNAKAPGVLAKLAAERGIPFVHISTDYVFDGSGSEPWKPDDPIAPLGVYGQTKAEGEAAVRAVGGAYAILRTSWVFSAHGANFAKTMLRLGAERDILSIVADQIGGPTPARDIAAACAHVAKALAEGATSGTYHFSGAPDVSWANFAREIFSQSGLTCVVTDIPSTQYPTPAARPMNSRLECSNTAAAFGIERPDWVTGLKAVLADLEGN